VDAWFTVVMFRLYLGRSDSVCLDTFHHNVIGYIPCWIYRKRNS